MWKAIFGNDTAGPVLACLLDKGPMHVSAVARECQLAPTPVLNQLERFQRSGLLGSTMVGRNRVFRIRASSPLFDPVARILSLERPELSPSAETKRSSTPSQSARRPRRPGPGGSSQDFPPSPSPRSSSGDSSTPNPIVEGGGFLG